MPLPGIFCLEGDWSNDFNRSSTVKPILDLLGQGLEPKPAFVHRDVATRTELAHYLRTWGARTTRYPILYLAFHGAPGRLYIGDEDRKGGDTVTLDDIAAMIGPRCSGRMVHFGSCSTLAVDRRHITRFLRRTGVIAATGFKADLDWLTSAAFEVLILGTLVRYRLTVAGARRMEQALRREVPYLRRELAFTMVIREP